MDVIEDPISGPIPSEVPLRDAPLERVIAQIRFPLIVAVEDRSALIPFQKEMQARYPVLRQEQIQGLVLGPTGMAPDAPLRTVWRFTDKPGEWRISLASEFLALETTSYKSRSDFLDRLQEVVTALDEHFQPPLVDRVGIRYIDRILGEGVEEIAQLFRPEVAGLCVSSVAKLALHSLSESVFVIGSARLTARWGLLGSGETPDPNAIEPSNSRNWILDLDMSKAETTAFSVDSVLSEAGGFAERIYAFFRWAVSPEFLLRYGA